MESQDFSVSPTDCQSYRIGKISSSVESSPPTSSSVSGSSDTAGKMGFSGVTDEDVTMASLSQNKIPEFLMNALDCPTFVPRGILSNMANPTAEDEYNRVQPQVLPYQEMQQQFDYRMWNFSNRIPAAEVGSELNLEFNPVPQSMPSGRFQFGHEDQHEGASALCKIWSPKGWQSPSRKVFEFPEPRSVTFPLSKAKDVSQTFVHVYTDRKINFAETIIPFVIQVLNPPLNLQIHSRMFLAMVRSPIGNIITCRVRNSESYIINSFVGTFKAEEEAGDYEIHVRMVIPSEKIDTGNCLSKQPVHDGVVYGSTFILVSKNYPWDCQRDCLRIRCDYRVSQRLNFRQELMEAGVWDHGILPPFRANGTYYPGVRCKLWGLTCDLRNNNLVYTDREAHQVYCVAPDGNRVFQFGQNRDTPLNQRLTRPTGIVFDETHNRFVVCDKDNHRVCFFSLNGEFLSCFGYRGHRNGEFEYPWDVDVAANGHIVVSDSKNKRIQLFDQLGNYLSKYTVFEVNPFEYKTQFDYPRGVCFDNNGYNIFVTDFNVNNVLRIPSTFTGHSKILPNGTLLRPQGITMDSAGNIFLADSRHDCIRHMNTRGEHLSTIREVVKQSLTFPINVTTMAGGFLAILNGDGNIIVF